MSRGYKQNRFPCHLPFADANRARFFIQLAANWLVAFGQNLHETSIYIQGLLLAQDVVTRPCQLVCESHDRHDAVGLQWTPPSRH